MPGRPKRPASGIGTGGYRPLGLSPHGKKGHEVVQGQGRYRKVSKKSLADFINGVSEEVVQAPAAEPVATMVTPQAKTVYSADPVSKPHTLAELF